jgi:ABC-2 type transport system permease protein
VRALRALVRKELAVLFGSPLAYLALTLVVLVTALIFFDHLRIYNQILFLYSTTTMGGFDVGAIPSQINLRDTVFYPVMDSLGLTLVGLVPLVTMRVFSEERSRGTDELLASTRLGPGQIVVGKFAVTFVFVVLMMAASFVYPTMAVAQAGVGVTQMFSVFLGLSLYAIGLAAIGLACSAFTSSQLVAAVAAWAVGFVMWDFAWAQPLVGKTLGHFLDAISMHQRYGVFAEGIVDVSSMAYFAGMALVAMALARFSFDWRRIAG